jgi:2-dehydropantoate 2-reductase
MGGTIGAYLVRSGHELLFVDIAEDHVRTMKADGLRITGPIAEFDVNADAVTPEALERRADRPPRFHTVLLAVKAHHTERAIRQLVPYLADSGVVVSVQNGLNEETIASVIGRDRTFGCFVNFGADYLEPGVIHYGGRGAVVVGELDGRRTDRAKRIHRLFLAFDDRAVLTDNVFGYLWSKLAYASMLFATALTDDSIADALARAATRDIYVELAREVVRVALAAGVRLESFDGFEPRAFAPESDDEVAIRSLDRLVAHNRKSAKTHSGIWRDLAVRHRKTEVDAQLGPVVQRGADLGVPVPLNEQLIAMIHQIEDGSRDRSVENLVELRRLCVPGADTGD